MTREKRLPIVNQILSFNYINYRKMPLNKDKNSNLNFLNMKNNYIISVGSRP